MTIVISEKGGLMSAGKHQVSVIGIVVQFPTRWSTANAVHQFRNLGAITKLYYMVPLEGLQLCSVCDLAKIFFTSKFSYFLIYNPIIKLKLGQQIGGKPLIANPPGAISVMGQSETLSSSQIIFPTLFSACAPCFCAFHQPLRILQLCWAKPACLDCSWSNFTVQAYIHRCFNMHSY